MVTSGVNDTVSHCGRRSENASLPKENGPDLFKTGHVRGAQDGLVWVEAGVGGIEVELWPVARLTGTSRGRHRGERQQERGRHAENRLRPASTPRHAPSQVSPRE